RIVLGPLADPSIELRLLLFDLLMNSEQAVDDRPQRVLVVHQSEHLDSEICADGSWKQHSNFLEQATNLIFQVAADANQAGAGHKKRANDLASIALDPDLAVPTNPDEFGEPSGVIRVALVQPD